MFHPHRQLISKPRQTLNYFFVMCPLIIVNSHCLWCVNYILCEHITKQHTVLVPIKQSSILLPLAELNYLLHTSCKNDKAQIASSNSMHYHLAHVNGNCSECEETPTRNLCSSPAAKNCLLDEHYSTQPEEAS